MNDKTKSILEKYDPVQILDTIIEHYNPASIRGGIFVVIDQNQLSDPDISKELKVKRGPEFFNNLLLLAKKKQPLYVSALKIVKPTSAYISEISPNNFEEADVVIHKTPGLYSAPITVPVSILKTIVDPMFAHQLPIDDELSQKSPIVKGQTLDNEYNKGKQPKGTRTNGGNN